MHRSTVVSTYWIWSGLYVSSTENMEVCSGVLIIDYKRPLIKALKRRDNRSWTEMFNRSMRGKLECFLLNGPQLSIDGPFTFGTKETKREITMHVYNSLCWFVKVLFLFFWCIM